VAAHKAAAERVFVYVQQAGGALTDEAERARYDAALRTAAAAAAAAARAPRGHTPSQRADAHPYANPFAQHPNYQQQYQQHQYPPGYYTYGEAYRR